MTTNDKNTLIPLIVASFIIAIFVSFFGGMYYGKSKNSQTLNATAQNNQGRFQQNGNMPNGFSRMQGDRPITGEVTAISGKTITITLQNDSSTKTMVIADNTNITDNGTDSALSNIKIGDTLMVIGQTNTDGSIKAQMIKINPTTNN